MSGTEFNLAALPPLPSAAFYLTSALISFPTIFGLPSPVLPPAHTLFDKWDKTKQTKHFPWFISLFIQEVHFEVSWGYSITQLEKKKSDKQVVQQKCGRLADKSLDRARSADIATIKRNARWLYIIWFKWLLQCTVDTENKWSGSFHFIICIYEPVMWCGDEN